MNTHSVWINQESTSFITQSQQGTWIKNGYFNRLHQLKSPSQPLYNPPKECMTLYNYSNVDSISLSDDTESSISYQDITMNNSINQLFALDLKKSNRMTLLHGI